MTTEGMAPIGATPVPPQGSVTAPPIMTEPVVQQPQQKPQQSKWLRWAGYLVGLIAIIRGGAFLVGWLYPSIPTCDASKVQDTINDIYKNKAQMTVTAMTDVQTLSTKDDATTCHARIVLSNGAKGPISYTLIRDGRTIKVHITDAKDD